MRKLAIYLGLSFIIAGSYQILASDDAGPVGTWKTIDDKTKEVTSLVEISKTSDGHLLGKIIKLFPKPDEDPDPVCTECEGELYNKKILGMKILWGFIPDEDEGEKVWVKGKILDPDNGEIYSCKLTVHDGGKSLEVRGYIGISLIGRSQTWIRVQ